jgi:23S rRNA-/tRNA-specific pseudouridylate synthase
MARQLTRAFTDRKVTKYYTGVSFKAPKKKKQGWIQGYMRRGRRKSWYLTREAESKDDDDAVWAQSFFWTAGMGNIADYFYPGTDSSDSVAVSPAPRTLLLLRPHTGRTHQLRVAAKSVGLPLAGDPLYTTASATTVSDASPTVPRTCLHATGLYIAADCFDDDVSMTEDLIFWSPPPFLDWWRDPKCLASESLQRLLQKDSTVPPGLLKVAMGAGMSETNDG